MKYSKKISATTHRGAQVLPGVSACPILCGGLVYDAAGDMILSTFGQVIRDSLREHDIPCRYGGEEFAVIFPATGIERAFISAERLRKDFQSIKIRLDNGKRVNAAISIGVGQLIKGENEKCLFNRVDQALYMAKSGGRNQVVKSD